MVKLPDKKPPSGMPRSAAERSADGPHRLPVSSEVRTALQLLGVGPDELVEVRSAVRVQLLESGLPLLTPGPPPRFFAHPQDLPSGRLSGKIIKRS